MSPPAPNRGGRVYVTLGHLKVCRACHLRYSAVADPDYPAGSRERCDLCGVELLPPEMRAQREAVTA